MQAARQPTNKAVISIVEDLTQDWGLDQAGSIDGNTLLVEQLDFASVDIIQLCVALEQHFGQKLGFQDLLMVEGSYVGDLSIAQISDFVSRKIAVKNETTR